MARKGYLYPGSKAYQKKSTENMKRLMKNQKRRDIYKLKNPNMRKRRSV